MLVPAFTGLGHKANRQNEIDDIHPGTCLASPAGTSRLAHAAQ
ncbi:hypothetical protein SAZ10_32205 [Mesorhizobium sp. BAC0120]|nr:hypothetical protein [Mesorhizobium sp. BAC0120]MDW6026433.1 hypothetical protein [Mesorhizobium sp. BAC0120]